MSRTWLDGEQQPDYVTLVEAGEYRGEIAIAVAATQLGELVTPTRAKRVIDDWIRFFEAGPSPIRHLEFRSRTPARLFDALREQTQLQSLALSWGDYSDLSTLGGMTELEYLELGGATSVESLEPLVALDHLRCLDISSSKRLHDYGPLGRMLALEHLQVWDGMNGPRLHADSIEFARSLPRIRTFVFSPIVDSLDYSAVLELARAELVRVSTPRGMSPTHVDLEWRVPGVAAAQEIDNNQVVDLWVNGEYAGAMSKDITGRTRLDSDAVTAHDEDDDDDDEWLEGDDVDGAPTPRELELISRIDQAWRDLMAGRRRRSEFLRWARESEVTTFWESPGDVLGLAGRAFETLVGEAWDENPAPRAQAKVATDYFTWRSATDRYVADPSGYRRTAALEMIRESAQESWMRESHIEEFLARGFITPSDVAGLGPFE